MNVVNNKWIKIIKKINDLYINERNHYLKYIAKDKQYITLTYNKNTKRPLVDTMIEEHLQGKTVYGVFPFNNYCKFICFDVDIPEINIAKHTVYRIINTLQDIGISNDYINVSFSGKKGYHIEIFFTQPVHMHILKQFYLQIINTIDVSTKDVELRPNEYGVKLPLGKHPETKNKCWFCDWTNQLKPIMDYDYILNIKKFDRDRFYDILNRQNDKLYDDIVTNKNISKTQTAISKHKPLPIYNQNIDVEATIERCQQLEQEGFKYKGSRHNTLLLLSKYYRYCGLTQECTEETLIDWMQKQNKNTYSTKWDDVLIDIKQIVRDTYEKGYSLVATPKNVDVTENEVLKILELKTKGQKLLTYSMLVHSKRYAVMNGLFYMTYKQMMDATGLSKMQISRLLKQLEELKIIEIVERNVIDYWDKEKKIPIKKPNKYKICIADMQINNEDNIKKFKVCDKNCTNCFNACICNLYDNKKLKELLPRRQYEDIKKYKDYCISIA